MKPNDIALKLCVYAVLIASGTAYAQYKVVGPDGKVTYTDQPSTDGKSKVQTLRAGASSNTDDAALPYATAQAARNFPVVLYSQDACAPCDAGRTLLRARGIPFEEKTVSTQADLDAFKAINRDGQLPVLTVGREQLSGYEAGRWNSSLSAAGYPANTTLPNSYAPKKSALAPQAQTQPSAPENTSSRPAPRPAPVSQPEAGPGFKFQK
jgi:glutaredoxin